ncbi:hypothetical protein CFN78_11810 [Amycolatopsis antarctica]|uniref:Acyl-CoA dehydrogenase n=1 Tax=Amycolatopsis antarctica TaxID=1854586 RepID=A0A263D5R7_9PSEU|nr:acyl-CoA dehydrogenase [Amycolatopsis antarctica]OZM72937.1 hypothetical protein CFN78_11810 [Amycolatopsis antarctica]
MPGEQGRARVAELEARLGAPWEPANPLGFDAVLAADEREEMFADGERALDDFGLNAEFVPVADGGRFHRLDDLIEVMRTVYRRDPCLGLGYGASSFIAGVNAWAGPDGEPRARVAELLLANRKVACAYHELAHGNDMAGTELAASADGDGFRLDGRKEVVTNIERSDALVLFARTGSGSGPRQHSQLLVEKSALPGDRYGYLPRFASTGMRGVQLGGMRFDDCPVPAGALLGERGHGLETAIRAFQLTRTALPAMATSILDTGLRTTLRHVRQRTLYGGTVAGIPHVRAVLAGAFADLLMCEVFTGVAARALHLLPGEASVYAPAVKYGVSRPLIAAMSRLGTVLGAQSYLRTGEYGIFQKLLRDIKPVAFAHVARATCQTTVLPQLPAAARRSWSSGEAAPEGLFDLDGHLAPLRFDLLTVSAGGRDHLASSLPAALDSTADDPPQVRELAARFAGELRDLTQVCASLRPRELTITAAPSVYALTDRYVAVLAAAACFGVWRHRRAHGEGFLADPAWLVAVLSRLSARTVRDPLLLPPGIEDTLLTELFHRHDRNLGFGVTGAPVAG